MPFLNLLSGDGGAQGSPWVSDDGQVVRWGGVVEDLATEQVGSAGVVSGNGVHTFGSVMVGDFNPRPTLHYVKTEWRTGVGVTYAQHDYRTATLERFASSDGRYVLHHELYWFGGPAITRYDTQNFGSIYQFQFAGSTAEDLSSDGRYVLYGKPVGGVSQLFVADAENGAAAHVQVSVVDGASGNGASTAAEISKGGRFVAFLSAATNFVPGAGDTNGVDDVFVKDLATGAMVRASVSGGGGQANGASYAPSISDDGRFVVFASDASNLVADDTNGVRDVFLKDLATGAVIRLSVANDGDQANGASYDARISGDGRYAVFVSNASNLVAGDGNGVADVFHVSIGGVLQVSGATARASDSYVLEPGLTELYLTGTGSIRGIGNALGNTLIGNEAANILRGRDGDDVLNGGLGYDTLDGGDGNDWLYGGGDADGFHGGAGNDALNGGIGADTMYGEAGDDGLFGGEGNDTLSGGDGADYLVGGNGDNALYGDAGADSLNDGDGSGYLVGGAGDDGMFGGGGTDQFFSGAGSDWMVGGNGADLFVFAPGDGADTIVDFNVLEDHVNLGAMPGIDSFADVEARMSFNGTNTVIDLGGGDMITIMNVRPETLTGEQFYV